LKVSKSIRDLHEIRHARALDHTHAIWAYKVKVYQFYHSQPVQYGVAGLILINFIVECIQRQVDPYGEMHERMWSVFEDFFCAAFLVELLVNMYGSWMKPFFRIGWNYFDMFVVAIGILVLVRCPMPGKLSLVMMLRSFRVFRLFGRVESLKKILRSISLSIPGMFNAFVIMLLVVCIYAVLAVDLYSDYHVMVNPDPDSHELTARGERYSEEYYGTFFRSLYTLFQILTGESWSEAGVRPILAASPSIGDNVISAIFFISFVLINAVVLLNVVVAVLLDGMAAAADEEDDGLVEWNPPQVTDDAKVGEVEGEGKKEQNGNSDEIPHDTDNDGKAICKDMAVMKQQFDTMSVELKEVLAGMRLLEEKRLFSNGSKDPLITL